MKMAMFCAGLLAALVLLGTVGQSDYQEAKAAQSEYCKMVRDGHWPDYEGKYAEWCIK